MPLARFAQEALTWHINVQPAGGDGLPFPNSAGGGWRRSGLPSGYGMHALRHTYASSLIAAGQHARVIQDRLGHSSITETMDAYGHLFPQAYAETAAALDQLFGAYRA